MIDVSDFFFSNCPAPTVMMMYGTVAYLSLSSLLRAASVSHSKLYRLPHFYTFSTDVSLDWILLVVFSFAVFFCTLLYTLIAFL